MKTVKDEAPAGDTKPYDSTGGAGTKQEPGASDSASNSGSDNKGGGRAKKEMPTVGQGYDYKGQNEKIGVILALRSERFNNKVIFSTFTDQLKNYVLSNLVDAQDIVPIVENLIDTTADVLSEEPVDPKDKAKTNMIKQWLKQEEVKAFVNCLKTLRDNKQTLFGLIWGQLSSGLQEALKGEDEYT